MIFLPSCLPAFLSGIPDRFAQNFIGQRLSALETANGIRSFGHHSGVS